MTRSAKKVSTYTGLATTLKQCIFIIIIIIFRPWYFIPRVWDIKQSVWCLERLQWGLGNCKSVRQADCVETLDCRGDPLVQECRYYYYYYYYYYNYYYRRIPGPWRRRCTCGRVGAWRTRYCHSGHWYEAASESPSNEKTTKNNYSAHHFSPVIELGEWKGHFPLLFFKRERPFRNLLATWKRTQFLARKYMTCGDWGPTLGPRACTAAAVDKNSDAVSRWLVCPAAKQCKQWV